MNMHGTTILCVRRDKQVAIAGDGQITLEKTVVKGNAKKVRKLYDGKIISGFAGSVADALTLYERIDKKIKEYSGDLVRASVELAREWREDKYLRRLEAMLVIADANKTFLLSGTGEVIEGEEAALAIGSGGDYARAAAEALVDHSKLSASEIAQKALEITSRICIYSNDNITLETIDLK